MSQRGHNPAERRLHLPIAGVTNGPGANTPGAGKPPWLKVRLASGPNFNALKELMRGQALHTVCEEALCPNIGECWEAREATFLLLGSRCTRRCGFCDVMTAKPDPVDEDEPRRIAHTVAEMGLRHVVLTGVARDDLPDGGAAIWAATIKACKQAVSGIGVEVLPSDFKGGERDIATVLDAGPDVFAHNLETVPRLHGRIRPAFGYERSLRVLRFAKDRGTANEGSAEERDAKEGNDARRLITKSNLILGMGETPPEVRRSMRDLAEAGVDLLTIGQYLQPTRFHLPVDRWVTPQEFAEHADFGERELGFAHVEAGPLVRSSYHAGEQVERAKHRVRALAGALPETKAKTWPGTPAGARGGAGL
jgi:lipoyl synthase